MMCPICGSASEVRGHLPMPHEHRVLFNRVCDEGHKFMTVEVHVTQLADARELSCAVRNIQRRIARWHRDLLIAEDTRPSKVVAAEHGITDTRVRQIRASHRRLRGGSVMEKISSQLRKETR